MTSLIHFQGCDDLPVSQNIPQKGIAPEGFERQSLEPEKPANYSAPPLKDQPSSAKIMRPIEAERRAFCKKHPDEFELGRAGAVPILSTEIQRMVS
jgi:hypothetical protein